MAKNKGRSIKYRMINTKFWSDPYVQNLVPDQKLFFLYCISNPLTNVSGVYEISKRQMSFDTGFNTDQIENMLKKFGEDRKIFYIGEWLVVKNFIHNQILNPSIVKGIWKELSTAPDYVLEKIEHETGVLKAEWPQSDPTVGTGSPHTDPTVGTTSTLTSTLTLTKTSTSKPHAAAETLTVDNFFLFNDDDEKLITLLAKFQSEFQSKNVPVIYREVKQWLIKNNWHDDQGKPVKNFMAYLRSCIKGADDTIVPERKPAVSEYSRGLGDKLALGR